MANYTPKIGKDGLPSRGLIVRQPWASMIVTGEKSWEIRGANTQIRGVIGIIAAKTGLVIGIAHLMQVIGPLCLDDYIKNRTLHVVIVALGLKTLPRTGIRPPPFPSRWVSRVWAVRPTPYALRESQPIGLNFVEACVSRVSPI